MTPAQALTLSPWPLRHRSPMLGALPTAPGVARAQVEVALRQWGLLDLIDTAQLVASELTTNAVTASTHHATRQPRYIQGHMMQVCIDVFTNRSDVRLEVWDQSPALPKVAVPEDTAEGGRGLCIVAAMTRHLGWTKPDARGWKCVYAVIGAPVDPQS
jgi:anti-sigma regulatory factor (Ser/Thr protein kinase)